MPLLAGLPCGWADVDPLDEEDPEVYLGPWFAFAQKSAAPTVATSRPRKRLYNRRLDPEDRLAAGGKDPARIEAVASAAPSASAAWPAQDAAGEVFGSAPPSDEEERASSADALAAGDWQRQAVVAEPKQLSVEDAMVPAKVVSACHTHGRCRPCLFVKTRVGCDNGEACTFCHVHDSRSGASRPCKAKRERYRKLLARRGWAAAEDPESLE